MDHNRQINIVATLDENEALAFAQFLKRAGLSEFRLKAVSEDEAYLMRSAGTKIEKALAEQGVAPR
jgi:hypothetical protein